MKRLMMAVMMAAMMAGGAAVVQADGAKCGMCAAKMDAGKKADKLALVLDLSDKQKEQVKQLIDAKHKKLDPAVKQMEDAMSAAKADFEAGMKKILSDKQAKKLDSWKDSEKGECGH